MSEKITVEGRFLNEETNLPLPFATVFVNHTAKGTVADEDGLFKLEIKQVPNPDRPSNMAIFEAKQQLKITKDLVYSIFGDSLSAIVRKESLPKIIDQVEPEPLRELVYSRVNDGVVTLEFEDFTNHLYQAVNQQGVHQFICIL